MKNTLINTYKRKMRKYISKKYKKIKIEKNYNKKQKNKFLTKKHLRYKYKKFREKRIRKQLIRKLDKLIIKCIIQIILFILIIIISKIKQPIFVRKNSYKDNYNIISDKWIVMTAFNSPSESIINLEKNINNWKIVVIGNNKTINSDWNIFINSNKLIYLSIEAQNKLEYKILKYLNENSYSRKNIGYLFAIQHGAKEIYELDENLTIRNFDSLNINISINNNYICYGKNQNPNEQEMINPYVHFCESNIWPRGFLIKDISTDYNKSIYYTNINQIKF